MISPRDKSEAMPDEIGRLSREGKPAYTRTIIFGVLGAFLAWQVTTRSLVAFLAEAAPDFPVTMGIDDPVALLNRTEPRLYEHLREMADLDASQADGGAQTPTVTGSLRASINPQGAARRRPAARDLPAASGPASGENAFEPTEARRQIELSLKEDPVSPRAFRLLGQLEELEGNKERAARFHGIAASLSSRETESVHRSLLEHYEAGRFAEAAGQADAILRSRPDLKNVIVPVLAAMSEDPAGKPVIKGLLANNPPWRQAFFTSSITSIRDATTPLHLLKALSTSENPPTPQEINGYIDFLLRYQLYEFAYQVWLQFLPPERLSNTAFLYDGGFDFGTSDLPFEWRFRPGAAAIAEAAANPDGDGNALYISIGPGRVQFGSVMQRLVLPPGDYKLSYRYRGEIQGRRGLKWLLGCAAQSTALIEEGPMFLGKADYWREAELSFTVPAEECQSQMLRLTHDARSESERFATGTVWYDDMKISRR